jgi:V/A-type H+-transporting ATPase subunit I
MPKLQKLKVILLDNYQEQVHLYLSKMGVAQYIKVDCEENGDKGFLHACEIPSDESLMNSEIQTRIKKKFGELNLKPDGSIDEVALLPGNTIKEILHSMEKKLKEIEEEPDPIIEMLDLASSLIKTTEQQLHARKISTKKLNTENIFPVGQHTSEEILSETEHELLDIEHHLEETAKHILEWQGNEYSENHIIEENPEKDTIQSSLSALNEMTKTIDILQEAKKDMAQCDKIVYFEAWVLKKKLLEIEDKIKEITHGICVIEEEKTKPDDNVPNVIRKPPLLLEGFESLTFSLGYPRKGEINPTYLMAFTFPFLFGIMFADVGQGIILIILGLFLLLKRIRTDMNKVGEIKGYLLRSAGILTLCGISSTIFGYFFGEFFGPSGVLHPVLLFEIGPFKFGGFDPMHEPLTLLRFTILIGVSFISFSLVMSVINNLRRREVARAFANLCWIWFLLGGFVMWVYWGGISQITSWFGEGLPMFAALVIAPLVIMLIVIAKVENFMEGVDLAIEVFIESLGHTLSFCRLAALFLTHTALNSMFLELGGVENGYFPLSSIPLIIIGTILTLSIEGLLVMIHCLRLHWIELLPKFYSGDGILFKPIKIK